MVIPGQGHFRKETDMPNDMMDDGMEGMYPSEGESTSKPESIDEEESETAGKTALIPKAMLKGKGEVGHVCKMKVVADYGDEVEMEYVPESESETKSTDMMSSDEEIEALDKG